MMWVGIAVVTTMMRVRRAAIEREREFAFQPASLFLSLLMMKS